VPRIADSILPLRSLIDRQAPKAGLAAPKPPQPLVDFVDIAALAPSSVQTWSSCVGTEENKGALENQGTEENQSAFNIIRARFVGSVFRQPPILQAQNTCEEELGTGIPTVLQGNIVAIILNAVRKLQDHNNGILRTAIQLIRVCRSSLFDIQWWT
jgi:hypothetical protein